MRCTKSEMTWQALLLLAGSAVWANETPPPPAACPVIQPVKPSEEAVVDLKTAPIAANADSTAREADGTTTLSGNVNVVQGTRRLQANGATLDEANNRLLAEGEIQLTDRSLLLRGENLQADLATSAAELHNVRYQLTDRGLRGTADRFDVDNAGVLRLDSATFTSCPENQPTWMLSARSMELDRETGWGDAQHMRLDVGGLPVFYLPYIRFPIDDQRHSGVLLPSFGSSQDGGLDIAVPVYVNLADNYDATLTPHWIEKRGNQLGVEFRHLGENSETWITAEGLPDDRAARDQHHNDRWAYHWRQDYRFSEHWQGKLDAAAVSDDNYFSDLGSSLDVANKNYVPRTASLRFRDQFWQMEWHVYQVQALQLNEAFEPFRKVPEWRFSAQAPTSIAGFDWQLDGSATRFVLPNVRTGDRYDVSPVLRYPLQGESGFLIPQLKWRYTHYKMHDELSGTRYDMERSLPVKSLDAGLFFERHLQWFKRDLVQTLEPRLLWLQVPFTPQQYLPLFDTTEPTFTYNSLFRDNRFIGADRVGDTEQISVGVSTRFLSADGGDELLRFAIGQAHYLNSPRVQLTNDNANADTRRSPLFTEGAARIAERWELRQTTGWDAHTGDILQGSFSLNYSPDERRTMNLEYRYRTPEQLSETEQVELSLYWPVNDRWQIIAHHAYDDVRHRSIDSLFGMEYESCCYALRVAGRRYLNVNLDSNGVPLDSGINIYDNGFYVQFVFKGFASTGGESLRRLLTERIEGFNDRLTPQ